MPSDISIRITTKDASQADLRKAGQELEALGNKARSAGTGFSALTTKLGGIRGILGGLGLGIGVAQLAAFGGEVLRVKTAFDSLGKSLKFGTGSMEGAAHAIGFLRSEASRLGAEFEQLAPSFAGIVAAAKNTALEGKGARIVFTGLSEAQAVLGLSSDTLAGALFGIQQILSSDVVSLEDLRQVTDRLPGGFRLAAGAIGKTQIELKKLIKLGELQPEQFVLKFGAALTKEFGPEAAEAAKNVSGEINKLKNAWLELKQALGTPVGTAATATLEAVLPLFRPVSAFTKDPTAGLLGTLPKETAESIQRTRELIPPELLKAATIGAGPPPPPPLDEKIREKELEKVRVIRIDLLRLAGEEAKALELEHDIAIKLAQTPELRLALEEMFAKKILAVRQESHKKVLDMIAEELQAGKDFADEEEKHRREVLDERQQDAQDILEARNKAETDARQAQLDKWRQQDEEFEREAQGQLAELADQWRATGGQMEDVIDRFFGRFTSGLSGLRGEFSDFGDFLLDLLSSIGGQAAKEFLGEKVKGIFGRITGFLGDLLGIKREPTFGQPGGPPGPPQQGQQATLTRAGLIQGGASIASLAGQFIPGRAGSIISGAGSGALLGFQLGGGPTPMGFVGAGIGAVAGGLLGGIFGGGGKEKDPVRAQIKQWVSTQLWPALQELKRLGFGPGGFGSFAPSGTTFFKALGFESGIPQQLLADMKRMADTMKSVISEALERGFSSFSISAGWERFLRNIRRGLADYIGDAFRNAIVRGGLLSQAIAPFVQETAKLTKRFRKGRISGPELESGILASFAQALPGIEALEPVFERLAGISRTITSQVSGQTRGTFISIPVTVHANIASGIDARMVGENLAYGIEMKLKQSMALGIA